jgi:rhodanese-related sulfurtransferase
MRSLPQGGRVILRPKITMEQVFEFTGNHPLLVTALMISLFVVIFSELRRKASGMVAVSPADAVALINSDAAVVDLRSSESFMRGHIVNAKNIPFDEFSAKKDALNTATPVIAVCDAGITSNKAVAMLRQSGFESAYSLKGGMNAWGQAGLPVVSGKKTKSKSKKS